MKKIFSTIKLGINRCFQGEIQESSPLSTEQKNLSKELGLNTPPRFFKLPKSKKKKEKSSYNDFNLRQGLKADI